MNGSSGAPPNPDDKLADLATTAFECAEGLSKCATVGEVESLFAASIAPMRMVAYASGMVTGPRAVGPTPFHFLNWQADWLQLYVARNYAKIDPIPRWAIISGAAASWSDVLAALPPKDPGHEVAREGARFGFCEGFVTPVRTADGDLGLVSVGGPQRPPFSMDEKLYLQTVSIAALQRANLLMVPTRDVTGSALSMREKECVMLLGQGLTDREISRVLNISAATTRFHIDNARKKMGARSRAHLAMMMSARSE